MMMLIMCIKPEPVILACDQCSVVRLLSSNASYFAGCYDHTHLTVVNS